MVCENGAPRGLTTIARDVIHSLVLVIGIGLITGLCAYTLWGYDGVMWTFVFALVLVLLSPRIAPEIILRMYGGRRVSALGGGADLLRAVEELARRAELPAVPKLYVIPSPIMNAFATGVRGDSIIAVTHGMLTSLTPRELMGVLAHETAHIKHHDLWVMNLADTFSRYTHFMSMFGIILFLINLPLAFVGDVPISWLGIVLLYFAPAVSNLLQLGLSRTREYAADWEGARLAGGPEGLISALLKLESRQGGMWESIVMPGRRVPVPSLLRTHPPTQERVARLRLSKQPERDAVDLADIGALVGYFPLARRAPRYHFTGLWH